VVIMTMVIIIMVIIDNGDGDGNDDGVLAALWYTLIMQPYGDDSSCSLMVQTCLQVLPLLHLWTTAVLLDRHHHLI